MVFPGMWRLDPPKQLSFFFLKNHRAHDCSTANHHGLSQHFYAYPKHCQGKGPKPGVRGTSGTRKSPPAKLACPQMSCGHGVASKTTCAWYETIQLDFGIFGRCSSRRRVDKPIQTLDPQTGIGPSSFTRIVSTLESLN